MKLTSQVVMLLGLCCGAFNYAVERPIVVIIRPSKNAVAAAKALNSVKSQKYANYRIAFSPIAAEAEDTVSIGDVIDDEVNALNGYCPSSIEKECNIAGDNEIVLLLRGDDWLPADDILAKVNAAYEEIASN